MSIVDIGNGGDCVNNICTESQYYVETCGKFTNTTNAIRNRLSIDSSANKNEEFAIVLVGS